jgi:hypothetical protein
MLSSPVFSRLDAAIIVILLFSGTAMMIESHHRIQIVASEHSVPSSRTASEEGADFTTPSDPILAQARGFEPLPTFLSGE